MELKPFEDSVKVNPTPAFPCIRMELKHANATSEKLWVLLSLASEWN